MDSEIWRDISGYEGLYQVSNLRRVRRLHKTISMIQLGKTYKNAGGVIRKAQPHLPDEARNQIRAEYKPGVRGHGFGTLAKKVWRQLFNNPSNHSRGRLTCNKFNQLSIRARIH